MKKALLMLFTAMLLMSLLTAAVFAEELTEQTPAVNVEEQYFVEEAISDTPEPVPEPVEVQQEPEIIEEPQQSAMFEITPLPEETEVVPLVIEPAKTVLVSFNMNGFGVQVAPHEIVIGTAVTEPPIPQCDGKVFTGWFNEPGCVVPWNFDALVCADTVLYAGWKDITEAETQEPVTEEPETEEPETEEPETEEPETEEPETEEPETEEPETEEPETEEPETEEPDTEEPETEEPETEEPKAEEPVLTENTETVSEAYIATVGVGEHEVKYTSLQAAIDACPRVSSSASTVRLLSDTTESVTISEGRKINLDLGGNTIYGCSNGKGVSSLNIQEATVTLKNGQISAESDNAASVSGIVNYGGKLVVQGVDVVCSTAAAGGRASAVYEAGRFKDAYMKILSGRFYAAGENAVTVENSASTLHIYGGSFSADGSRACSVKVDSKGSTSIVGGSFFGHIQSTDSAYLKISKGMYSETPNKAFIMYGSRCKANSNPETSRFLPYAVT